MIGEHPSIVKLRSLITKIAATDVTVLITGESGSGKEIVARSIHDLSTRKHAPFVPVNCAAIPHELLESEMFGHERGAFTGAANARGGLFWTANGGTLFLDEIGEMPLQLQAKLLRVLEDSTIRPVGSDRWSRVDVRVVAASNVDLPAAVKKGTFREDLFYRLQIVPIMIPPLRERRSDIPVLVDYFLARMRARMPGHTWTVSPEAMVRLWSYDWPGNVRELDHTVERLVILSENGAIDASLLPSNLFTDTRIDAKAPPIELTSTGLNLNVLVRDLEGRLINEALKQTGGNKQAAARLLGLKRTTFAAKLRRCGVVASEPGDRQ